MVIPTAFTETLDAVHCKRYFLRHWPVLSVSSVIAGNLAVPAATSFPHHGYLLSTWDGYPPGSPQWIDLFGYGRPGGRQNVAISYTAGYQISNEAQSVPASAPFAVRTNQPLGAWASDCGVSYANGAALTAVAGTPTQGQYSLSGGVYTFAAADAGAAISVSYGFIPTDLSNACCQWVTEWLSYQNRIGQRSKSLGGQETASFIVGPIPPMVEAMLQPYRRVAY
jgi:hypothetical protein